MSNLLKFYFMRDLIYSLLICCLHVFSCHAANSAFRRHNLTDREFTYPSYHLADVSIKHLIGMQNILSSSPAIEGQRFIRAKREIGESADGGKTNSFRDLMLPGTEAPPFELPTLDGEVLKYPSLKLRNVPIVFYTYDRRSAFSASSWTSESVSDMLLHAPPNAQFIFLSRSTSPYKDAVWMKDRVKEEALKLSYSDKGLLKDIMSQYHFVGVAEYELGNWIPDWMKNKRCSEMNCGFHQAVFRPYTENYAIARRNLNECLRKAYRSRRSDTYITPVSKCYRLLTNLPIVLPRQDARYDWLPSPRTLHDNATLHIQYGEYGCSVKPFSRTPSKTFIALVLDGTCSISEKAQAMWLSGARSLIVMADRGAAVRELTCSSADCRLIPQDFSITMIPYSEQLLFRAEQFALKSAFTVSFQVTLSDNHYLAIDSKGRLQDSGWLLYPSLVFLSWLAQGLNHKHGLESAVEKSYRNFNSHQITVFSNSKMHGHFGARAVVQLPPNIFSHFSRLYVELELSCKNNLDKECAEWDHLTQLFVCPGTSANIGVFRIDDKGYNSNCAEDFELARWVTPYRRKDGKWITDITPLMPILASAQTLHFTLRHPWWEKAWYPTMKLHFTDHEMVQARSNQLTWTEMASPSQIIPIYQNIESQFDSKFASRFSLARFILPFDVRRVFIHSLITGHGSDSPNNCAEFCPTHHTFNINGYNVTKFFNNAATPFGCAAEVKNGVTPNQHGTWLYGRAGWCPGQDVEPWVEEVTSLLLLGSSKSVNEMFYTAFYNGRPATHNFGYFKVSTYLVLYR